MQLAAAKLEASWLLAIQLRCYHRTKCNFSTAARNVKLVCPRAMRPPRGWQDGEVLLGYDQNEPVAALEGYRWAPYIGLVEAPGRPGTARVSFFLPLVVFNCLASISDAQVIL